MNVYMGLIAIVLAVVGAGGSSARDRWCDFWVLLIGIGVVLMLGKFTFLFDHAHRIPILGSSREPVRFHAWVSLGVAALAAVGVERIGRPGVVSLRGGLILAGVLVAVSIPIMIYIYVPVWSQPRRWVGPNHILRFRWLGRELIDALVRTGLLAGVAWFVARSAMRASSPARRARLAAALPFLVLCDLLGAHLFDVPTVDPRYWTQPPVAASILAQDPELIRVFGRADKSSGEPGFASEPIPIDFLAVRDTLDWSLPPVWGVRSSRGETPMISRRFLDYTDHAVMGRGRLDIEGVSHVVTGRRFRGKILTGKGQPAGAAFIHRNPNVLPRARLAGRPVYADDQQKAVEALDRLTSESTLRDHLVVEDPTHRLPVDATVSGTARIVVDLPERVVVDIDASGPAYLVLSDTFDPGWSATVDGRPAPILPAYVAFRAVFVDRGEHTVVFSYRPAGLDLGMALSACGILLSMVLWFRPARPVALASAHAISRWPSRWRSWWFVGLAAIVLLSVAKIGPTGRLALQDRWTDSVHRFTWGAGFEAMDVNRRSINIGRD